MTRKAPTVYSPGSPAAQDLLYIQALPAEKRERVLLRDLSSPCPHVDMRTKNFWRISEEKSPKFSKSNGKVPVVIWGSLYPSADMRFRNLDPECGQRLIISLLFRGTENRPAVIYIPVSGIPIPSLCDCDIRSRNSCISGRNRPEMQLFCFVFKLSALLTGTSQHKLYHVVNAVPIRLLPRFANRIE